MQSHAKTIQHYIDELPQPRKAAMSRLREVINAHIPAGFSEQMGAGMIAWAVPKELYPKGYHCNPELPLPFLNIASQKNFIAVYHMGIYADPDLLKWFTSEYAKHSKSKPDMGKSCIRFKKPEAIPFDLIAQLVARMTPDDWIRLYEANIVR